MKNYYKKQANEQFMKAQEYDVLMSKEMKDGTGTQAQIYMEKADKCRREGTNYLEAAKLAEVVE